MNRFSNRALAECALLGAVVVGSAAGQLPLGRARQLLTAPAVPVAALNTLGWAVIAGLGGALIMAATSGGLGVLVGLGVGAVLANVSKRPAHS